MKKTIRILTSMLVLLALLASLPISAMAEEQEALPKPVENNTSENNHPTVDSGEIMSQNTGTVTSNQGTITSNQGTITDNGKPQADGTKSNPTSGTVEKNQYDGKIENNYGTVVENGSSSGASQIINNYGTVKTNNSGYESDDNETVTTTGGVKNNYGLVETNAQGGVIKDNHGSVGTFDDDRGVPNTTNEGEVTNNLAHGFVFNGKNGVVKENCSDGTEKGWYDGFVNNYGGKVKDNSGLVYNDNNGTVDENRDDGRVVNNSGTVTNNHGTVESYSGTVTNNYGYVYGYDATNAKVTNNDGHVHGGTVETNNVGGEVLDRVIGHVDDETQEWVPDLVKSKVTTNYGTHVTCDNLENNLGYERTVHFGVHAMDGDKMVYLGQYQGAWYDGGSPEEVTIEKLQANCKDYKIFGIEKVEYYSWDDKDFVDHNEAAPQNGDSPEQTPGTTTGLKSFKIFAPTRLTLLWKKIVSVVKPAASSGGGAEAVPTSYNPKYIGLGSVIFINEKGYKVVEIKDDAFVVVSFDALSDEDVKDLDALFAKLFTAEQQKQIKNIGQLLDAEDVLAVFGKPGNHPVFEISKALVE